MKHISIRLPWHDRGWDGCVCDNPEKNVYCSGFHSINAELIRKRKDNNAEKTIRSNPLDANWEYCPPCAETINVFGNSSVRHTFIPKDFIKNTSHKKIKIPPHTSGTWPFEDMWDDRGQAQQQNERKQSAEEFFSDLESGGAASLVFYYCNYDNPVSGDNKKYVVTGISRVKKILPFISWDDIPKEQAKKYGNYVWSRMITNDDGQFIRLPYQEYINMGKDTNKIAVFPEGDLTRAFKYGAHHVTDDEAIIIIDKTIASVRTIIEQEYLGKDEIERWKQKSDWLYSIRKECWINRGLYPGLSPVLRFLGMEKPDEYIRIKLKDYPSNAISDYFFERFTGKQPLTEEELDSLGKPYERFQAMFDSPDENEKIKAKLCMDVLPFFDLDEEQIKNILSEKRSMYSIVSSLQSIYDNPYIIAEEYTGKDADDFVNFEKIDHGMMPLEELGKTEKIDLDDPRRLRCLMYTVLREAASEGHTFLEFAPLVERINRWHKENDKAGGMFNFDLTTWNQHKDKFEPKVVEDYADGIRAIYSKRLHEAERKLSYEFRNLINDEQIKTAGIIWASILRKNDTEPEKEQITALEKLYTSRIGILTGTAGTGKTTVIRSLVQGIKEKAPRHQFLLLAPTGKASLILRDRIKDSDIPVMTIHSLLMRKNCINKNNFTLKQSGDKIQVSTVIIDECSMIETQLFAAVVRAIDMDNIERMVLVGDYNQLPPIGPGKVFYDLIQYMKKEDNLAEKHLAELCYNWRQQRGSRASVLANHYARTAVKADESIFEEVESGNYDISNAKNESDLIIDYWKDEDELIEMLPKIIEIAVEKFKVKNDLSLGEKYDIVHGLNYDMDKKIDAIHVLAPYRHTPAGVDSINLLIQTILRGKETVDRYSKYGYVFRDKVLQVRNFTYNAWDHIEERPISSEDTYIPNGTLGFCFPKNAKEGKLWVKFPKEYNRYSYFLTKSQVGEMLELGYATSVHKAQGSQFEITILVLPGEESSFVNRELLYTALTRSIGCLVLLIQKNLNVLKSRLWLGMSDIVVRNSGLFTKSRGIPMDDFKKYKPENLIYEALPDIFVRSRDEVIISKALAEKEIGFYYEKPLISSNEKSFKLPDFTFKYRRKEYYWEHRGMLDNFDYARRDEKKKRWYIENGYQDNLIETPFEAMNLEQSIQYVFENILK